MALMILAPEFIRGILGAARHPSHSSLDEVSGEEGRGPGLFDHPTEVGC